MTIDADVVIAYLGGERSVISRLSEWRRDGTPLFLSTVAETEVLSFPLWTSDERSAAEQFLAENFTSILFDRTVARIAAGIRRGVRIKFPDAAIAATAIYTKRKRRWSPETYAISDTSLDLTCCRYRPELYPSFKEPKRER